MATENTSEAAPLNGPDLTLGWLTVDAAADQEEGRVGSFHPTTTEWGNDLARLNQSQKNERLKRDPTAVDADLY